MERCPNCHARWDGAGTCRRCGMDLGPLIAVEEATERLTAQGVAHLAAADLAAALRDLDGAIGLRREPFVELLLGFARHLDAMQSGVARD
jgi:hypothetical protein